MRRASFFALALLLLPVALPGCRREGPSHGEGPAPPGKGRVLFYRSPMNPAQTSPAPRKDEMGMDYLPVYEADVAGKGTSPPGYAPITIEPQRQQMIGLKTVPVRRAPLSGTLRTVGRVTYDETRVHHVHTRYEAYVEHLYADFTGKYVRRGEPLVSLYSPDLLSAEQEYLLAVRTQKAGAPGSGGVNLAESARQRLLLWNISPGDIAALERRGTPSQTMDLYAPISGYVVNKMAVHGMRVKPEDSLFDIVDLSRLWVLADIYEYELPRVRTGQTATMTLSYWPGRTWEGQISYIYPSVDPKTRTIRVRLDVQNPRAELKAEMFANVVIAVDPHEALVVPEDAVLETGTRRIVFLSLGQGRLLPREIVTGDRAEHLVEVRSGLAEGEEVAAGASFLIDSESRLQAAISAMAAQSPSPPPPSGGGDGQSGGRP